ncbi:hypothetical protein ACFTZB_08215 [Rhodococcus sp. NPDC057014]|uniref:hypothetical protein n=1 Tax=Rhodococcus sp. NPDC057014 TaxID=3346000 RepID=UPI00362CF2C3
MPLQIAPKLKAKTADQWMVALTGHLYPGEFVWALARTTVMRPQCDGLAITNARVLAFSGRDVAAKGPKRAIDADNISRFDLPTFGAAKQLVITTRDNQQLYFGILQGTDVAFVSHFVHQLGIAGLPAGMRGAHQPKPGTSEAEPVVAIQPKSEESTDADRKDAEEHAAAAQSVAPPPNGQKSTKAGKILLGIVSLIAVFGFIGLVGTIATDEEALRSEKSSPETALTPATTPSLTTTTPLQTTTTAASTSPTAEDGSIAAALEQAGATPEMVDAMGVVAEETGYIPAPSDLQQRQEFTYLIVLLCRDISSGATTWENSINEDIFHGAATEDAQRLNDYARTDFCPRVPPNDSGTTTPAASSAPADLAPIVLTTNVQIEGQSVAVSGTVPLPDGAKLSVSLFRIKYFGYSDEEHYGASTSTTATVLGEQFSATMADDPQKARDSADAYNVGEPPERQIRISDWVVVSVSFDPRDDQPQSVVSAVGGEDSPHLANSPQADEFGGLTDDPYWMLKVETKLELPFRP